MKKIKLLGLSFFIITFLNGQVIETLKTKEGNTYVDCNIDNLVRMLKMTNLDWDKKISELGGELRELENNGIKYMFIKNVLSEDGWQSITKYPDKIFMAYYSGNNGITFFDSLIDRLAKNYIGTSNGNLVYGFTYSDNEEYIVSIKRDGKVEFLTIKRKYQNYK